MILLLDSGLTVHLVSESRTMPMVWRSASPSCWYWATMLVQGAGLQAAPGPSCSTPTPVIRRTVGTRARERAGPSSATVSPLQVTMSAVMVV